MSTPTLEHPPTGRGNGQGFDPPGGSGGRGPAGFSRAGLLAVVVGAALLGAGAVTALLAAVGALNTSTKSTSIVEPVSASSGSSNATGLNPLEADTGSTMLV